MDRFDNDLRQALCRTEPPAGFSDRVLANVGLQRPSRRSIWKRRWWAIAAVVAASIIIAIVIRNDYQRRERAAAEAERVKQQVLLALRITQSQLEKLEAQLVKAQR